MAGISQGSLPTPQQPITQNGETLSDVWFRFFQYLFRSVNAPIPANVNDNVTALGLTQADATPISGQWAVITGGALGSGVILTANGTGTSTTIFNLSGTTIEVYPPIGMEIQGAGPNVPYPLSSGSTETFYQINALGYLAQ